MRFLPRDSHGAGFLLLCLAGILVGGTLFGQPLDLGDPAGQPIVDITERFPHRGTALICFALYLAALASLLVFLLTRSPRPWTPPTAPSLLAPAPGTDHRATAVPEFPVSGKALLTLVIVAFGLVHLFSVIEVFLQTQVIYTSAEEYFFYMPLAKLAGTSHAHFFGHATMYGLMSLMFLFTTVSERWKIRWICLALAGGLLDVPSWWMIKYAGGGFEWVSGIAGTMYAIGWSAMALRLLYECWFLKKS